MYARPWQYLEGERAAGDGLVTTAPHGLCGTPPPGLSTIPGSLPPVSGCLPPSLLLPPQASATVLGTAVWLFMGQLGRGQEPSLVCWLSPS